MIFTQRYPQLSITVSTSLHLAQIDSCWPPTLGIHKTFCGIALAKEIINKDNEKKIFLITDIKELTSMDARYLREKE